MTCAEAVRQLWAYLEGDPATQDRARVEAHLAWCRRCCGELEFARQVQRLLRTKTAAGLPDDVRFRLERFIDELEGAYGAGGG